MNAKELFQAGRLDEAIQALGAELRDNPADARRRTFLFELLCFAGEFDRAEKHLDILADGEQGRRAWARCSTAPPCTPSAPAADVPEERPSPRERAAPAVSGTINGKPFEDI